MSSQSAPPSTRRARQREESRERQRAEMKSEILRCARQLLVDEGSAAYGYLAAAYAIGSLIGALRGAGKRKPPTARRLVTATVVFGTLEALAGFMPGYATFLLVLVPTGLASVTVMTTANAMTQLNADPGMRGRIVSVHLLVLLGGTPVGAPLVGLVSDSLGARFSLVLGGAISAVAAIGLSAVITARSRTTRENTPLTAVASPPPISVAKFCTSAGLPLSVCWAGSRQRLPRVVAVPRWSGSRITASPDPRNPETSPCVPCPAVPSSPLPPPC
ncbi:MFS transporter [Streptomyces sp. NPDC001340]